MSEEKAKKIWEMILWDNIPEEIPDKIDLQMLNEIKNNSECNEIASDEEVEKVLKQGE